MHIKVSNKHVAQFLN